MRASGARPRTASGPWPYSVPGCTRPNSSGSRPERGDERRLQVGSGERSEKIRTYNYPQNRVTDHRIGLTLYRLETIVNGDLDEFVDELATTEQAERLQAIGV